MTNDELADVANNAIAAAVETISDAMPNEPSDDKDGTMLLVVRGILRGLSSIPTTAPSIARVAKRLYDAYDREVEREMKGALH